MDTQLAIASRREVRDYDGRPLPDDVVERILDAGRLAGSAKNRQPWTFVVVEDAAAREALAAAVYEPGSVRAAGLVVGLLVSGKGPVSFDAGRAAQNMLLAAWNEGVGGSPNGLADREAAHAAVGAGEDEQLAIVLTFGRPARPRDPGARDAAAWSARARRRPLSELVRRR